MKKFSLFEKMRNFTHILRIKLSGAIKSKFSEENQHWFCIFQQYPRFLQFRPYLIDAIFQPIFKISKNCFADLILSLLETTYWLEKDYRWHHCQNVQILPDSYRQCLLKQRPYSERSRGIRKKVQNYLVVPRETTTTPEFIKSLTLDG